MLLHGCQSRNSPSHQDVPSQTCQLDNSSIISIASSRMLFQHWATQKRPSTGLLRFFVLTISWQLLWDGGACVVAAAPERVSSITSHRASISPRIVQTHYGALRGIIDRLDGAASQQEEQQHGRPVRLHPVEKFLGVPYATPPINGLRFMPPLTPSPWDGLRTADRNGPACPQPFAQHQRYWARNISSATSEDCLYLNIFYPTIDGQLTSTEKPPVALIVEAQSWHVSGANAIDASVLASRGRLMVATVNFRLGVLGFLKTSPRDNPQGNYGMLDVIAAVHWLRLNAASFGGDVGRLTLIGIGQGAALVNLLMLSPVAKGLFQGGILLGGSALSPTATQPHPEVIRQQVAALAGCWDPSTDVNAARYDLAPCLRKLSLEQLLEATSINNPHYLPAFAPFVEGSSLITPRSVAATKGHPANEPRLLLRDVSRLKAEGFVECDVMVGLSTYEVDRDLKSYTSRPIADSAGLNEERRDAILRTLVRNIYHYHNNEIFAVLRNEYTDWEYPSKNSAIAVKRNLYQALSDGLVISPLMELLRYHAGLGSGRTWLYHLNYPPANNAAAPVGSQHSETEPSSSATDDMNGSFHGDGVFHLLGLAITNSNSYSVDSTIEESHSVEEIEVAEQLIAYVAGFCSTGDPNEHGSPLRDTKNNRGMIYWEPYTLAEQRYLSLGLRSRVKSHYRSHKMSVWLRLIPQLHQPGEEGVLMSHHHMKSFPLNGQGKEYEGIVRPYTITRLLVTSGTSDVNGTSKIETNRNREQLSKNISDFVLLSASDCPTQPPYIAVATATQHRGSNSNSSTLADRESDSAAETDFHPSPAPQTLWSFTNMLVIIIATGSSLLLLNVMVIACFCAMRRRSIASSRPSSAPILLVNKDSVLQQTAVLFPSSLIPPHSDATNATLPENIPRKGEDVLICSRSTPRILPFKPSHISNIFYQEPCDMNETTKKSTENFVDGVVDLTQTEHRPLICHSTKISLHGESIKNSTTTVERGSSPLLLFDRSDVPSLHQFCYVRPALSVCSLHGQQDLDKGQQKPHEDQPKSHPAHNRNVNHQRNNSFHEITV